MKFFLSIDRAATWLYVKLTKFLVFIACQNLTSYLVDNFRFKELPFELKTNCVAKFLSIAKLSELRCVNRKFNTLIDDAIRLLQCVSCFESSAKLMKILPLLTETAPNLREFTLRNHSNDWHVHLDAVSSCEQFSSRCECVAPFVAAVCAVCLWVGWFEEGICSKRSELLCVLSV